MKAKTSSKTTKQRAKDKARKAAERIARRIVREMLDQDRQHGRHGATLTSPKALQSYRDARRRATNPHCVSFRWYGGHPDKPVEFRFRSFREFWWSVGGDCPAGFTLDRIDPTGNYEPGNVRWLSRAEQNKPENRRKRTPKA